MNKPFDKIKLHGFNILTKSLSFSIYDICYAKTEQQRKEYIEYIDELPRNPSGKVLKKDLRPPGQ